MNEFELSAPETLKKLLEVTLRDESKLDTIMNALAELLSDKRKEPFEKVMTDLAGQARKNYQASLERLASKA